jgi:hypothetical protein
VAIELERQPDAIKASGTSSSVREREREKGVREQSREGARTLSFDLHKSVTAGAV